MSVYTKYANILGEEINQAGHSHHYFNLTAYKHLQTELDALKKKSDAKENVMILRAIALKKYYQKYIEGQEAEEKEETPENSSNADTTHKTPQEGEEGKPLIAKTPPSESIQDELKTIENEDDDPDIAADILVELQKHFIVDADENRAEKREFIEQKPPSFWARFLVGFIVISVSFAIAIYTGYMPVAEGGVVLSLGITAGIGSFFANLFVYRDDVGETLRKIKTAFNTFRFQDITWKGFCKNFYKILIGIIVTAGNIAIASVTVVIMPIVLKGLLIALGLSALANPPILLGIAIFFAVVSFIAFTANSFRVMMDVVKEGKLLNLKNNIWQFLTNKDFRKEVFSKITWKNFYTFLAWFIIIGVSLYAGIYASIPALHFWGIKFAAALSSLFHLAIPVAATISATVIWASTCLFQFPFAVNSALAVTKRAVFAIKNADYQALGEKLKKQTLWTIKNPITAIIYGFCGLITLAITGIVGFACFFLAGPKDTFASKLTNGFSEFTIGFDYMGIKTQGKWHEANDRLIEQRKCITEHVNAKMENCHSYQNMLAITLESGEMTLFKQDRYALSPNRYSYTKSYSDLLTSRKNQVMKKILMELKEDTLVSALKNIRNNSLIAQHRKKWYLGGFWRTDTQRTIDKIVSAKDDKEALTDLINEAKTKHNIS